MISDESGNRFFPTAVKDYWQDRAGIAYQQTDFSEFFPNLSTFSYLELSIKMAFAIRVSMGSQKLHNKHIYSLELFQYPAFATSFINRSTGAMHRSTVFDMLASPQLEFSK